MKIYPTSEVNARWDITTSVDLATATAEVIIAGVSHPLEWVSLSTPAGADFVRTAQLAIGGVDSTALVKVLESEEPLIQVTVGGEVLVDQSSMRLEVM